MGERTGGVRTYEPARARADASAATRRARALTPGEIAWIALPPLALACVAALLLLGPPLGGILFDPGGERLWPVGWWATVGEPEPTKHARYLFAMAAPLLLAAAVLAGARRGPALPPSTTRALTWAGQLLLLAFLAVAVLGQHDAILADPERRLPQVFGLPTLLLAGALTALAPLVMRRRAVAERVAALARETPGRRRAALAAAAAFAALWLLTAVTTDRLVEDLGQLNWALNDVFAVMNGRTNLVDYHVMYAKLLPYPSALVLRAFGGTGFVFTGLMATLNLLVLLAAFATFRRVARSSLLALGLFLPFVALSDGGDDGVFAVPATWPMRYGGAYLLAWLTVRHLDGARPRRAWPLFLIGGLVAIDNLEFGSAAVAATFVALLCARPPRTLRDGLRATGEAAAGLLGAVVLVSLFTLVRAGAPPEPGQLTEWPRIFSSLGLFSMPMPAASLHLAVYATFAAAVAVAAVRLARGGEEPLLTSLLAWSGVFGLVAGMYYTGRSDDGKLMAMFSAWGFALVPLTIVAVRALAARDWRRPTLPELTVLFGFALAVCSIGHFPPPWRELDRLTRPLPDPTYRATAKRFVDARTAPGETVTIMLPLSFRIAEELGLRNVAPYVLQGTVVTRAQLRTVIETARREGVHRIFVPEPGRGIAREGDTALEQVATYVEEGYALVSIEPGFLELSDVGTPIPFALGAPAQP